MNQTLPPYSPIRLEPDPQERTDISDMIVAFWQGKWLILFATISAILSGGYYAFVIATPVYKSSSVVILEPKDDQIVTFQSVSSSLTGDTPEVNSEVEILRARGLMHKVAVHLDLVNDPEFNRSLTPPTRQVVLKSKLKAKLGWATTPQSLSESELEQRTRDAVVTELLKKTRVENLRQSTVFRVTARTQQAAKSARIADAVAELYIQNQIAQKIATTAQATVWLDQRVSELQNELEQAETKVSDFSASTTLVSAENLQALKRQAKDLRDRIATAEQSRMLTALNSKTLLEADDNNTKVAVANDAQLTRFAGDRAQQAAFNTRFKTIIRRANDDLARMDQQLDTLKSSEAELSLQIAQKGRDLIALQQLNREAHATRVLYEHFLSRLKETASQQGIQKADSRILSPAVIPYKPSEPRKSLILSMSAIFGLTISVVYILIRELRRTTFRSLNALQRYSGLIALGQLPTLPVKERYDLLDHLTAQPANSFSNAVRGMRTSLMVNASEGWPKIIAITSAAAEGECGATAVALTHDLVGLGNKVLLVDTDLTYSNLEAYFGDEPTRGIASVLREEHGIDQSLHHPNALGADVLFADDQSILANDLFLTEQFGKFTKEMRKRYDVVIFNAPGIITAPSARIILRAADAILLNVKWDATTKSQLGSALQMLKHANLSVAGLVLTEVSGDPTSNQRSSLKSAGFASRVLSAS